MVEKGRQNREFVKRCAKYRLELQEVKNKLKDAEHKLQLVNNENIYLNNIFRNIHHLLLSGSIARVLGLSQLMVLMYSEIGKEAGVGTTTETIANFITTLDEFRGHLATTYDDLKKGVSVLIQGDLHASKKSFDKLEKTWRTRAGKK